MMVSASEDSGSVMNLEVPEKSHFIVLVLRYILAFIRTCSQKSRTRSYSRGDLTRFERVYTSLLASGSGSDKLPKYWMDAVAEAGIDPAFIRPNLGCPFLGI